MTKHSLYHVVPGDTPRSIAAKFKVPLQNVLGENPSLAGFPPDGKLAPGSVISVLTQDDPIPAMPHGLAARPPLPAIGHQPNRNGSLLLSPAEAGRKDEFELRIVIHLFMRQIDPAGQSDTTDISWRKDVEYVKWPAGSFEQFKAQAKTKAEAFWSNRFRLWAPSNYSFLKWPAGAGGKQLPVVCTLRINYVLKREAASFAIKCYRRSNNEHTAALDSANWTDAVIPDQPMELADKNGKVIPTKSVTVAHEVGHLLGLDHPVCSGSELQCYGDGGEAWQIQNIMGGGDLVNRTNAQPWLDRLEAHTGVPVGQWTTHTLDSNGNPLYL